MKKLNSFFNYKVYKVIALILSIIVSLFIILVIIRIFHYSNIRKIENQIASIDSIKISLDDVMGYNLPINSRESANNTLKGADINDNNIRDDIEIAIWNEYPNSAKIKAGLLQYALSLQMEFNQSDLNREIVSKIISKQSKANTCLSNIIAPRENSESSRSFEDLEKIDYYLNFIKERQFNTEERQNANDDFYSHLDDGRIKDISVIEIYNPNEDSCDIDISLLEN